MEWAPSSELRGKTLSSGDSVTHPELFPEEVLNALKEMKNDTEPRTRARKFRFEGWIIQSGIVGVRSDVSQAGKEEWMRYWERMKIFPFMRH